MKGIIKGVVFFIVWLNFFSISIANGQFIAAQNMAEVQSNIQLSGNASVIVEYQSGFAGASPMHGLGEIDLTNAISANKQRFETSLSAHAKTGLEYSFAYVPAVVLTVDAAMLEELQSNAMVKEIYPNKMLEPTLAESVDIVFKKHQTSAYSGNDWAVAVLDTGVDKNHTF